MSSDKYRADIILFFFFSLSIVRCCYEDLSMFKTDNYYELFMRKPQHQAA